MKSAKKRVLISVTDKAGIVDFAHELANLSFEIISTGGTAKTLKQGEIKVRQVEDLTGYPEILDGRVKTLHPKVFGALLAVRGNVRHEKEMAAHDIEPIDLVVVNLYPFESVVTNERLEEKELIEYIDIGGVTLLRAAGKNFHDVGIVFDPRDYAPVLEELKSRKSLSLETKRRLAAKAFAHTARYDAAIARWFSEREDDFPAIFPRVYEKVLDLPYGENPHQRAAYYAQANARTHLLSMVSKLHGKELSFNNLLDLDAARRIVDEFEIPAAVIVKHNNPCGCAVGSSVLEAFERALATDPVSAFGGVYCFNRPIDSLRS